MAQSGHAIRAAQCPLLGVKRTSQFAGVMSASDPSVECALRHQWRKIIAMQLDPEAHFAGRNSLL
jgi:hypothetical protein